LVSGCLTPRWFGRVLVHTCILTRTMGFPVPAFAYDHAGRLKEAYSGREARGLPATTPADSPFRQSFSYDVWNNMSRTGRHWTATVSDTPTYTNNRRTDWTYNSDGDVTSRDEAQRIHTYDAAGQQRNFSEQGLQVFGGGHYVSHQYTINQSYDGYGRAGKRIETRQSEDENGPLEDSTETSYQLHSSVLGGALIVEIDQWGNRKGHVYAGGELLADYQYYPAPYTITTIRHRNPATGQWVKNAVRTELDPLGADMGFVNPYSYNLSYSDVMGADNLYYHRGNALDIRGGCALNGLPIPCSLANEAIASETGSAAFEYRLKDGTLVNEQGRIYNLGAGLFIYDHPIVRDKGPWDFKYRDPAINEGKRSKYEAFGNFHYGATGAAAGFTEGQLLRLAGRYQTDKTYAEGENPGLLRSVLGIGGTAPYGDEPGDQEQIRNGINYYRRKFVLRDCE
jgi:hypothetical protein